MSKYIRTVVVQDANGSFTSYEDEKGNVVSIPSPFNGASRAVLRAYILTEFWLKDSSIERVHLTVQTDGAE